MRFDFISEKDLSYAFQMDHGIAHSASFAQCNRPRLYASQVEMSGRFRTGIRAKGYGCSNLFFILNEGPPPVHPQGSPRGDKERENRHRCKCECVIDDVLTRLRFPLDRG